jgi:HSP20 family molecular chaperone IbpA
MTDTPVAEKSRQDVARQESERRPGAQRDQRAEPRSNAAAMTPRVDIVEDETGITVYADMPGVSRDALEIKVEGESLQIEGAVTSATPQALEATYAEVRVPRYQRTFTLSRELDAGRIEASLKDGVLKLRIPKQEEAQPRRITVNVA